MSFAAREASELARVVATPHPRTRTSLAADLRGLGLEQGETLLVHASLASLGWVVGGQVSVVQALLDVLGPQGTLVVPAHTGDNSDPKLWGRPPVPEDWWPVIRAEMPAFDPAITPTRSMGAIAEAVRTWPGARRSNHPMTSFAAVGRLADEVTAVHDLDCQLGEGSPLGTLERLGARVLLLGVDWDSCTTFHLAEYRVPGLTRVDHGCAIRVDQPDGSTGRQWITFNDVDVDADDFDALGSAFEGAGSEGADSAGVATVTTGVVGSAASRVFSIPAAVRFAESWLAEHRAPADQTPGS